MKNHREMRRADGPARRIFFDFKDAIEPTSGKRSLPIGRTVTDELFVFVFGVVVQTDQSTGFLPFRSKVNQDWNFVVGQVV